MADYVIGIDPGFSGAIALLDSFGVLVRVLDMPVIPNKKGRTELNKAMLHEALEPPVGYDVVAYLEQVASRPGQGAPATFRFGQGYGQVEMALAAHKIPTHYVTPAKWKKHFGLSKDKGASRGLATDQFPQHAMDFARVKDDGRAEAALIALYGVHQQPNLMTGT